MNTGRFFLLYITLVIALIATAIVIGRAQIAKKDIKQAKHEYLQSRTNYGMGAITTLRNGQIVSTADSSLLESMHTKMIMDSLFLDGLKKVRHDLKH